MNNEKKIMRIRLQAEKIKNSKPIVKITYQGKILTQKYLNEHPELYHLYPSKDDFMTKLYLPLLKIGDEINKQQILEISEHDIKINGNPFKLFR